MCVNFCPLVDIFFPVLFFHAHTYIYIIKINHPHITCELLVAAGLNTHRWLRSDALLNQENNRASGRRCEPGGIVGHSECTCKYSQIDMYNAAVGGSSGDRRYGLNCRRAAVPLSGLGMLADECPQLSELAVWAERRLIEEFENMLVNHPCASCLFLNKLSFLLTSHRILKSIKLWSY